MFRYYQIALRLAQKSTHAQHKMAAVVIRGGQVVAAAANSGAWKRHAERRCLKHGVTGDMIVIARAGGGMSRPCPLCMAAIRASGIREIVYSGWDKKLVKESV